MIRIKSIIIKRIENEILFIRTPKTNNKVFVLTYYN